jgi:hypothetical protein
MNTEAVPHTRDYEASTKTNIHAWLWQLLFLAAVICAVIVIFVASNKAAWIGAAVFFAGMGAIALVRYWRFQEEDERRAREG